MSACIALDHASIFNGDGWREDCSLLIEGSRIKGILHVNEIPADAVRIDARDALVIPGFIDLQVNGGGGTMFNDDRTVKGIRTICSAHARFGTTALLPTLITDTPAITAEAIAAAGAAKGEGVPGFLGLHLEGPHLCLARKGAHDPQLIRPMEAEDFGRLLALEGVFDALMITIAPENVTQEQVRRLAQAGLTVSLGHTDASYETAKTYAQAGARAVTHLFNAMSPLENRKPGLVGAALDLGEFHAGIIADGVHVHTAAMRTALKAKEGPGRIFIVTDAMSTIGTDMAGFSLNGRHICRDGGRLTLADGTLAGADIDMLSSMLFMHRVVGLDLEEAIRMASLYPAEAIGVAGRKGQIRPGYDADFVVLGPDYRLRSTWIGGKPVFEA